MKTVTLEEAKLHLETLIDSASPGESIQIVREGIKVGEIKKSDAPSHTRAERAAKFAEIRSRSSLGGLTIRELRDEGRR